MLMPVMARLWSAKLCRCGTIMKIYLYGSTLLNVSCTVSSYVSYFCTVSSI
jgi:hypothetical protein